MGGYHHHHHKGSIVSEKRTKDRPTLTPSPPHDIRLSSVRCRVPQRLLPCLFSDIIYLSGRSDVSSILAVSILPHCKYPSQSSHLPLCKTVFCYTFLNPLSRTFFFLSCTFFFLFFSVPDKQSTHNNNNNNPHTLLCNNYTTHAQYLQSHSTWQLTAIVFFFSSLFLFFPPLLPVVLFFPLSLYLFNTFLVCLGYS